MSQSASPRKKFALIGLAVLVVAGVVAIGIWRLGGDDSAEPLAAAPTQTTAPATTATPTPTPEETTPTPSPTPTPTSASPTCEGPDTVFNEEGVEKTTLLPDCGVAPVDVAEQQKTGLSLACGGSYPVILYKTTTSGAKVSICGRDSSGADFRFVTRPTGGDVVDLAGRYEPDLDAFVAKQDGTTYTVQAYDGTLLIDADGSRTTQKASDWISLDNEADTD
ncbi:MAG: hypothetical protein ABW075_08635 [Aeromicrobium sp.]